MATAISVAASADANVINVFTPQGAFNGQGDPVRASATFTTGTGSCTLSLSDLLPNPTSVGQLVSGISFSLPPGLTSGTLGVNSGIEIRVGSDAAFKLGSTVSTGWGLTASSGLFQLSALGTATSPAHLIIGGPGPGLHYTSANGSIAGDKPHNPFLAGVATFTLNIPGMTPSTSVTGVNFSFGTEAGDSVPGVNNPNTPVPDAPSTVLLLGVALFALRAFRGKLS